jgi:ribosomal protein L23
MHGGKQRTLKPLGDDHIKSDVELVVRKKLHKPKVQQEVHDVLSIDVGDVSAMPVDDKPILVGDKTDEATLVVDVDVAACATVPVCVEASMQTNDICADDVSVHMAQMRVGGVGGERVSGDSGQRHCRARSTVVQFSATPRIHGGKTGSVLRQ